MRFHIADFHILSEILIYPSIILSLNPRLRYALSKGLMLVFFSREKKHKSGPYGRRVFKFTLWNVNDFRENSRNECIYYCKFGLNTTKVNKNEQIYYSNFGRTTIKFQKIWSFWQKQCQNHNALMIIYGKLINKWSFSIVNLACKRQKNINGYYISNLV